jgi:hypothetical protein
MPRKALATARAALRFAQRAADECGATQPRDDAGNRLWRQPSLARLPATDCKTPALEPLQSCEELPLDNVTDADC